MDQEKREPLRVTKKKQNGPVFRHHTDRFRSDHSK